MSSNFLITGIRLTNGHWSYYIMETAKNTTQLVNITNQDAYTEEGIISFSAGSNLYGHNNLCVFLTEQLCCMG